MEYPETMPVMMLPNATLFPNTMLPLFIFEPRYCKMLQRSLKAHRLIAIAMRKPGTDREIPHKVAGLGMIRAAVKHADGTAHIILQGVERIRLHRAAAYKPYRTHHFEPIQTSRGSESRIGSLRQKLLDLVNMHLEQDASFMASIHPLLTGESHPGKAPMTESSMQGTLKQMVRTQDVEQLSDLVSGTLITEARAKQVIMEESNLESRLNHLVAFLMAEIFCRKRKRPS
jgi:ATP-dependent Lon protease